MSHKPPPTKLSQITVNQDGEDCKAFLLPKPPPTMSSQIKDCCEVFWCCIAIVTLAIGFGTLIYYCTSQAPEPVKSMEFSIADASITHFYITSDNTLYYHFKLNITVTNPDDYDRGTRGIKAFSFYKGNKFAVVDMKPFALNSKKTIMLKPVVFYGNSLVKLSTQELMEYDNERRLGVFNLDLKLDLKYNDRYVYCIGSRIPLIFNEKLESTFNATKCSREYQGWG